MEILFWILVAMSCITAVVWLYTIVNKKTRRNRTYLYPAIALNVLALMTAIISLVTKR